MFREAGHGSPGCPGRAGRQGGRATLTRCCCRLLTATAAADAALCRSSAACPGLSRLRVNLRVRSPAIAGRADLAAGPERVFHRPSQRRSSLPTAVQEAELGAFPPLFLAVLARGGFFSPATSLLHPFLSAKASRRLSKLCGLPGARGQLGEQPGPAAAPLQLGRRTRVRRLPPAPPPGSAGRPGLSPPPLGRQTAGEGAGCPARAAGGACPRLWSPFGGSLQSWRSHRIY